MKNYFKLIVALVFATNVMAQNIPSYVPTNGLVGWWPFNGNANDESGNGNHGTVNGATLTADRNGDANSAYSFVPKSNILINQILYNTQFSISFWFYANNNPSDAVIFDFRGTNKINSTIENYETLDFTFFNSNTLRIRSRDSIDLTTQNYNLKNNITLNQWNNIQIVYQNSTYFVYINSVLNSKISNQENKFDFLNLLNFGNDYRDPNHYFNGKIDDIAIYNSALSDLEVKQLYEGCTKETATSSSFNSYAFTNNSSINLSATPTGGTFSGEAITNNAFEPSKAKLGKNQVKYNFKNSSGCADSTNFTMILVDTLGNKCSTYDTLKIKIQLTTGIKAGQLTSMNVYPNPASDLLIIEANDIQALNGYKYEIVDLQGKEVYNALATTARTEISLKSIGAKGMYILHIVDEKGVSIENKKIVLE